MARRRHLGGFGDALANPIVGALVGGGVATIGKIAVARLGKDEAADTILGKLARNAELVGVALGALPGVYLAWTPRTRTSGYVAILAAAFTTIPSYVEKLLEEAPATTKGLVSTADLGQDDVQLLSPGSSGAGMGIVTSDELSGFGQGPVELLGVDASAFGASVI